MAARAGTMEGLGRGINNGFQKLKDRFNVMKEDSRLDWLITKTIASQVKKDVTNDVIKPIAQKWENSGNNIWERLGGVAKSAGEVIGRGFNVVKENVAVRMTELQERYKREGVKNASVGIVKEALNNVSNTVDGITDWALKTGVVVNATMTEIQTGKIRLLSEEKKVTPRETNEERFIVLKNTIEYVKERRAKYTELMDNYNNKYNKMVLGRARFTSAKLDELDELDEMVAEVKRNNL